MSDDDSQQDCSTRVILIDGTGITSKATDQPFDSILNLVGEYGGAQQIITIIAWLAFLPEFMMLVAPVFQQYMPQTFCQENSTQTLSPSPSRTNDICTDCPDDFLFDASAHSTPNLVTEHNLICGRRIYSTYASMGMLACKILGALFNGPMNNLVGRKPTIHLGLLGFYMFGMAAVYSDGLFTFSVFRAVSYGFAGFASASAYILLSEIVGPKHRGLCGMLINTSICVGIGLVSPLSHLWPHYKDNQFAICQIGLVSLIASFFAIESPRLLHEQGKSSQAKDLLLWMAMKNRRDVKPEQIQLPELIGSKLEEKTSGFADLFSGTRLAVYMALSTLLFMTVNLVVTGLLYSVDHLPLDLRLAHLINAGVEIIGVFFGIFVMDSARFGRRGGAVFYLSLTATLCTAIGAVKGFEQMFGVISPAIVVVALAFLAQAAMNGVYPIAYTWVIEIFPTPVRAHAYGVVSVSTACANLFVPVVLHIFSRQPWLVQCTFAGLSLVTAVSIQFLPETLGKPMLNTIKEFNNRERIN